MKTLVRGLAAGALGGTVLNAVTYLDMAITGRSASSSPADTALAVADAAGLDLPTGGSRGEAYGALAGMVTATGVGVAAALVRTAGIRLPLLAEAAVVGAGAMAASDVPMARLGVSDPTTWTSTDWVRDAVPHLAYGATVAAALRALETHRPATASAGTTATLPDGEPRKVLRRSVALGLATGARSSLGLVPVGAAIGGKASGAVGLAVATELVMDKLPSTPSRLGPPTAFRAATAAAGALALSSESGSGTRSAAVVAAGAAAVAGAFAGAAWRELCAERSWTWRGAVVEDAVAGALTALSLKDA